MQTHSFKILMTLLVLIAPRAWADDVIVIAHAGVQLTADEVRHVFVGDKQFAGTVKLTPIDNAAVQSDFLAKAVKVDGGKYSSIWAKKSFREGVNPPPLRGGDAEIILAVKSTAGTIGYVRKAPEGVKIIGQY